MTKKINTRGGFTLVELLIVIGVVAVSLSLLLPALTQAKGKARRVYCQSNLRQINVGVFLYADDHQNRMPVAAPHRTGQAARPRAGE